MRRRCPSPEESCEYIRIFMRPFLLGIGVPRFHSACTLRVRARPREPREELGHQQDFDGPRDLSRDVRSWWPMFCTAITTSFTKRTLGHSHHHLLPPCLFEEAQRERSFALHDPINIAENNESAMNPRLFLGTVNRRSDEPFLPLAIHYSFAREQNGEPFPRRSQTINYHGMQKSQYIMA